MSRESHRTFLERSARRTATRAFARSDHPLTKDELARLRIQTVEPWKRILLSLAGLACCALALVLCLKGSLWPESLLFVPGLALLVFGLRGRKQDIDSALGEMAGQLIEGLLTSIDF